MILVTGGTGFVGQELVKELLAQGHSVRLLVRHPGRANRWANEPRVQLIQGDALKPETLPPAMVGVNAVIHLIGIIAETSKVTFKQAHVEATRNVLSAAKQAGVTRWIQMSAAGTRSTATSNYHLTKWQAEELVRESGLDWTIMRPSLIYGYDERDRLLNMLKLLLTWPVLYSFPVLNGGRPLIQPISVREVAHCFGHAISKEASIGQTYDLVGPIPFTWRELFFKVARALGRDAIYEEIPIFLMLRVLLWLAIVVVPFLIIMGLHVDHLSLLEAELSAGLWAAVVVLASQWKRLIFFKVPDEPLRLLGEALNAFAPRSLQMSEQLKMATEDNIGDPRPATQTFGYVPETFEEGLARIIPPRKRW